MSANHLIKKLGLLCVIQAILGGLIYSIIPANQAGYIAAVQDKEALLSSSQPPRIIFIGGSNIAFGINSELIQDEFNLPVINFSVHAGLGMQTNLNIVEPYIAPGDIIVLSPEYEFFNNRSLVTNGSNEILADFLDLDLANIRYLAKAKWIELPIITSTLLERKVNRQLMPVDWGVYVRSSFNTHGDVVAHLGKTPVEPDKIVVHDPLRTYSASGRISFNMLEGFNQRVIDKGGIVLFDFPSLRMRNCDRTGPEKFEALFLALKTRTTIPLLSTPADRCYPDSYFFDTPYHLSGMGRDIRTQQLIKSLSLKIK